MIDPNGRQIDYQYNSALDSAISRPDAVADDSAPTLPLATTCANSLIEQDTATAVDSGGVLPASHFLQYSLGPMFGTIPGELVTANSGSYDGVAIQNNGESIVAGVTGSDLTITRYAVSGTLDPTFGTAGVVTISESSPTFAKLALDSSGNIDVAVNSGSNVKVYQLSGSGSTNWSKTLTFATDVVPQGIALESSGDIVVAGDSSSGTGIYLAGLNPSTGAIDTGFGSSGYVNAPLSGNPSGLSVALDSSGKILVAGSDSGDFSVVRFTSSGSLGTSFNSTGEATVNLGGTDTAYAVAPGPAGTIVAAGVSVQSGNNDDALIRLTSSGALDTSFNSTGKIVGSSGSGTIRAILVQTNGEVSGLWLNAYQARGGPEMAHLLRCRSSTTLPAESLRRSASHLGHFRPATTLKRLEPEPAGGDASSGTAQKVWMFTPAGAADTAFVSGGTLTANSGATVYGWAVASGPTQRIVVAGSYGGDEALAAFAPASVRLYAQQDANYNVTAMVDSNGNVVRRYVYDSYGNMTVLSATWTPQSDLFNTQVGFQGMWLDAASGLYHTLNRDYSSSLGRWMEQDRGYWDGSDLYQTEDGDPAGLVDPVGLAPTTAPDTDRYHVLSGHNEPDAGGQVPGLGSNGGAGTVSVQTNVVLADDATNTRVERGDHPPFIYIDVTTAARCDVHWLQFQRSVATLRNGKPDLSWYSIAGVGGTTLYLHYGTTYIDNAGDPQTAFYDLIHFDSYKADLGGHGAAIIDAPEENLGKDDSDETTFFDDYLVSGKQVKYHLRWEATLSLADPKEKYSTPKRVADLSLPAAANGPTLTAGMKDDGKLSTAVTTPNPVYQTPAGAGH